MIAVLFEVMPHPGHREAYLAIAARLKAELVQIEGFVDVERFESLSTPGKLLSLSWWRDEAAVARWRAVASHQRAHVAGARCISRITGSGWRRCCGTTGCGTGRRRRRMRGRGWGSRRPGEGRGPVTCAAAINRRKSLDSGFRRNDGGERELRRDGATPVAPAKAGAQ